MSNLGGFKICGKRGTSTYLSRARWVRGKDGAEAKCASEALEPCMSKEFSQLNKGSKYDDFIHCVPKGKLDQCPITSIAFIDSVEQKRLKKLIPGTSDERTEWTTARGIDSTNVRDHKMKENLCGADNNDYPYPSSGNFVDNEKIERARA